MANSNRIFTNPGKADRKLLIIKHFELKILLLQKVLQLGLCLPKSCSSSDVWNITQNYFDGETIGFTSEYEFQPKVVRVKTLNVETNFFKKTSVQLIGLDFQFMYS